MRERLRAERWLGVAAIVAVAGCVADAPQREVVPPPPVVAAVAPGVAAAEAESMKCEPGGTPCTLTSVTTADVAVLDAMPRRDRVDLHFTEHTTSEGLATIAKVGWITRVWVHGGAALPDLAPLAKLPSLRRLVVDCGRCLKSAAPLASLRNLEELAIEGAFEEFDAAELAPLAKLKDIDLGQMRVKNLAALAKLPWLAKLHLSRVSGELGGLKSLARLDTLQVFSISAPEYSWLAGMSGLTRLMLRSTTLADLSPLEGLVRLEELDLGWNKTIQDLGPLKGLTHLRSIELDGSSVSDLGPLAGMHDLEVLRIQDTGVGSLAPLAKLTKLRTLEASRTAVADLAPLARLDALEILEVDGTQVRSIVPLAGAKTLYLLQVDGTEVRDVRPLASVKTLRRLRVPAAVPQADLHALKRALPEVAIEAD